MLACALTEEQLQTEIASAMYLHSVQCQRTESSRVLQYSSETAKEFSSFYKWLRVGHLLKKIYSFEAWSSPS